MKLSTSKKVPEGFMFIDWRDSQGNVYKDVMPMGMFNYMCASATVLKVVRSEE